MAYTSQAEIQTAFYSTLVPAGTLDATLASLGCNAVYDWMAVPQNAAFDYITLGDGYEIAKDTFGPDGHANGFLYYATLHVWSAQRSSANAWGMIDRLNTLFHRQSLTLQTLTHVYTLIFRTNAIYDQQATIPVLHIAHQYQIYSVQS